MRRFALRFPLLAIWTAALAFQFLNLELQDKASEGSRSEFSSQVPAKTKVMEPSCEINRRAPQGGSFRTAIGQEPTSLNPLRPSDAYANAVLAWTHEGLMVRDLCTNQWRPGLALSYSIEDEGRAYRFRIRPGVKFHDGSELTSEDVAYSFEAIRQVPELAAARADLIKVLDRVQVDGRLQVVVRLKEPYYKALDLLVDGLSVRILPRKAYAVEKAKLSSLVVGTGPYRFKEWVRGKLIRIERSSDWWGNQDLYFKGSRNFAEMIFRINQDPTRYVELLEKGEIDVAPLNAELYHTRFSDSQGNLKSEAFRVKNSMGYSFLAWNLRLPMFRDVRVRKALSLLIDRKEISTKFTYGSAEPVAGPWLSPARVDPKWKPLTFQRDEAVRLLREAGWLDRGKSGLLERLENGSAIPFRFTVFIASANAERYITQYAEVLKSEGIEMKIQRLDFAALTKALDERKFEAVMLGLTGNETEDDPYTLWHSDSAVAGGGNFIGFKNDHVDKSILDLRKAKSDLDRNRLYQKLFREIAEQYPMLFLLTDPKIYYAHSDQIGIPQAGFPYGTGLEYWWAKDAPNGLQR